jgi:hypothetical protein
MQFHALIACVASHSLGFMNIETSGFRIGPAIMSVPACRRLVFDVCTAQHQIGLNDPPARCAPA